MESQPRSGGTLENLVDHPVMILTNDGRIIMGTLKGFDQNVNVILDQCCERVFSLLEGVEEVNLGLYIVRGDNIAVIGDVDSTKDSSHDWTQIKAAPINAVVH